MSKPGTTRTGEIVSHATMAVVGVSLLFGGYKCLRVAYRIGSDFSEGQQQSRSGGIFVAILVIGIGLILVGAALCLGAVVPTSRLEKMFSPPTTALGEEPAGSSFWRAVSWVMFWW